MRKEGTIVEQDVLFMTEEQAGLFDEDEAREPEDSQKYLIFLTGNLKFGVNADCVVEIITNHAITFLPMVPDHIRGIINLRGQMVPIVDIRLRLGKMPREECLIIVLNIESTQIGILVDSVEQMIDIPKRSILPVPAQSAQHFVSGMCSLPDHAGTMLVLECAQLLLHE